MINAGDSRVMLRKVVLVVLMLSLQLMFLSTKAGAVETIGVPPYIVQQVQDAKYPGIYDIAEGALRTAAIRTLPLYVTMLGLRVFPGLIGSYSTLNLLGVLAGATEAGFAYAMGGSPHTVATLFLQYMGLPFELRAGLTFSHFVHSQYENIGKILPSPFGWFSGAQGGYRVYVNDPVLDSLMELRWFNSSNHTTEGYWILSFNNPELAHCGSYGTSIPEKGLLRKSLLDVACAWPMLPESKESYFKIYIYNRHINSEPRIMLRPVIDGLVGKTYILETGIYQEPDEFDSPPCFIDQFLAKNTGGISDFEDHRGLGSRSETCSGYYDPLSAPMIAGVKKLINDIDYWTVADGLPVSSAVDELLQEPESGSLEPLDVPEAPLQVESLKGNGNLISMSVGEGSAALIFDTLDPEGLKISLATSNLDSLSEQLAIADRERGITPEQSRTVAAMERMGSVFMQSLLVNWLLNRAALPVGKTIFGSPYTKSPGAGFSPRPAGSFSGKSIFEERHSAYDRLSPDSQATVDHLLEFRSDAQFHQALMVAPVKVPTLAQGEHKLVYHKNKGAASGGGQSISVQLSDSKFTARLQSKAVNDGMFCYHCKGFLFGVPYQNPDGYRLHKDCYTPYFEMLKEPEPAKKWPDTAIKREALKVPLTCQTCQEEVLNDPKLVVKHLLSHNQQCTQCQRFIDLPQATEQARDDALVEHKKQDCFLPCSQCRQPIRYNELGSHQQSCTDTAKECSVCNKFVLKSRFLEHVEGEFRTSEGTSHDSVDCPECSTANSIPVYLLQSHLRDEHDYGMDNDGIKCPVCEAVAVFQNHHALLGHMMLSHKKELSAIQSYDAGLEQSIPAHLEPLAKIYSEKRVKASIRNTGENTVGEVTTTQVDPEDFNQLSQTVNKIGRQLDTFKKEFQSGRDLNEKAIRNLGQQITSLSSSKNAQAEVERLRAELAQLQQRVATMEAQGSKVEGAAADPDVTVQVTKVVAVKFQEWTRTQQQGSGLIARMGALEHSVNTLQISQNRVSNSPSFFNPAVPRPEEPLPGRGYDNNAMGYIRQVEEKTLEIERTLNILSVHHSELELQLQASLASTHNGAFLWRVPEVRRRIRDAKIGRITSIYSPPFYTGRNGYKMCIRAYLNGDGSGEGTHLSTFFVIMKGEYDSLLQWPFDHKVSLVLVDQDQKKHLVQSFKPDLRSASFQKPKSDMNVASGCPEFAKLSILDDPSYVKDDVLFIKAIVDTRNIVHP